MNITRPVFFGGELAKRFTDSRKFNDSWYLGLPIKMKVAWEYLLSTCDHNGVYKINFKLMSFCVGQKITGTEIDKYFQGRIHKINSEKLFIPKFIHFQYGVLNKNSRLHAKIIKELKDYNLLEILENKTGMIPCQQGIDSSKDKDKDKDKDKGNSARVDKEDKEKIFIFNYEQGRWNLTDEEIDALPKDLNKPFDEIALELDKAAIWLKADKKNRKKNHKIFFYGWFGRRNKFVNT